MKSVTDILNKTVCNAIRVAIDEEIMKNVGVSIEKERIIQRRKEFRKLKRQGFDKNTANTILDL